MKQFKFAFLFMALLTLGLSSCGNKAATTEEVATEVVADTAAVAPVATDGPEYTSAFVCPMHCEGSGSDVAGKCPKCGMDYVANAEHTHEGGEQH